MLPKIMTFYWGNEKMSFLRFATIATFRMLNPDWKIRLVRRTTGVGKTWESGENLEKLTFNGDSFLLSVQDFGVDILEIPPDESMSDVHVSDMLTWETIHSIGGFVADMDIVFRRPMNTLHNAIGDKDPAVVCFSVAHATDKRLNYYPVSFLGGKRGSQFYLNCLNDAKWQYDPRKYESVGEPVISNRYPTFDHLLVDYPNAFRMPDDVVFPFVKYSEITWWDSLKLLWDGDYRQMISDDCIGLHWYGATPQAIDWSARITRDNYKEMNNTVCKTLVEVLYA